MDSCQTLVMYVSCRANELIRFWGHEVKGQRSQGSLCMQKQLVIALSEEPIDGLLPNLGHVCSLKLILFFVKHPPALILLFSTLG